MKKPKHEVGISLSQGHPTDKQWTWALNSDMSDIYTWFLNDYTRFGVVKVLWKTWDANF